MQIPKSVRIGKKRYVVKLSKFLSDGKRSCEGMIEYEKKLISIATHSDFGNFRFTKEQNEIAFLHEVVHGILHDMRKHDLNRSESFVQGFAVRLYDAIRSAARR